MAALALLWPAMAQASAAPVLVADTISYLSDPDRLVATGNVEFTYQQTRMNARKLEYNRETRKLRVTGPLTIKIDDETLFFTDFAEIDEEFQNGLLVTARLLMDRHLQIASSQITRVGGRYTTMENAIASSCRICSRGETPAWEIKARHIVHDQRDRLLYFKDAQLRLAGVPVLYLNRLALPDPTVKRASGFLIPSFSSSSALGFGVRAPFFLTLGEHADMTLTPFITTKGSRSLEYSNRQRFRSGQLNIEGSITRDSLTENFARTHFFADGKWHLGNRYVVNMEVETTSDKGYLLQYGHSSKDRLESGVDLGKTTDRSHFHTELTGYYSLRDSDPVDRAPSVIGEAYLRRLWNPGFGGKLAMTLQANGFYRRSELDSVGRDLGRTSGTLEWQRDWIGGGGILVTGYGGVATDIYQAEDDIANEFSVSRTTPTVSAAASYPMLKRGGGGIQVIEPKVQAIWSRIGGAKDRFNEDSVLVDFDETNLFSHNRFPGLDRREYGARLNMGGEYLSVRDSGWLARLQAGRILRLRDRMQFSGPSGLSGRNSSTVASAHIQNPHGLSLSGRTVFTDSLTVLKTEGEFGYRSDDVELSTSYIWLEQDISEGQDSDTSEWTFTSKYPISDFWRGKTNWQFDADRNEFANVGGGLVYSNECITVSFSFSRRFTSSRNVKPSSELSLTFGLGGFGSRGRDRPNVRKCNL